MSVKDQEFPVRYVAPKRYGKRYMCKAMGVTKASVEASLVSFQEVFGEVSEQLDRGTRPYIFDSLGESLGFTVANLATEQPTTACEERSFT